MTPRHIRLALFVALWLPCMLALAGGMVGR